MPLQGPIESTSSTMYDITSVLDKLRRLKSLAQENMARAQIDHYDAKSRKDSKEEEYQYGLAMAYAHMTIKLEDILKELGQ